MITLTLNERLDDSCVAALAKGLAVAELEQARVVVIEGKPEMFCLGMDFATMSQPESSERKRRLAGFADVVRALLAIPIPTLAVIDGPALGGGLGLAAACDYVLATERSRFGLPEALYGLAPAIIRPALLTRLMPQQLRMLVATAHSRSVHQASSLGLVDEIVTVEQLAVAKSRAIRQLRRASTRTMAALRRWDSELIAKQLAAGVEETAAALEREDVRAALLGEDPSW